MFNGFVVFGKRLTLTRGNKKTSMTNRLHRLKINYRKVREQKLGEKMQPQKPIIFFDGICHLCNGFVDLVIQKDRHALFQFAPLQGETAAKLLTTEERAELASVVLWQNGQKFTRSEAVLRIFTGLGGIYRLFAVGYILPPFLRNALYNGVAKNRYAWFGQRETCRRPLPHEKDRLLP
jgi:predicted DCC family thiol-disulfide oxidoreductase YuxK